MARFLVVAGARPNFMKIAPVLAELDKGGHRATLVHTGQHYDPAMSDVFFGELGIPAPDHHLEVGSASHAVQTARIMEAFEPIVIAEQPEVVIVAGDVNSTVACALVAAKLGAEVAHIEAGLRSRDWDMPEEINRVVTDRLSQYLLAPSADAVENLKAEGYPDGSIHLVGNVMVDTLLKNLDRAKQRPILDDLGVEPGGYGLLTLHRPSNVEHGCREPHIQEDLRRAVDRWRDDIDRAELRRLARAAGAHHAVAFSMHAAGIPGGFPMTGRAKLAAFIVDTPRPPKPGRRDLAGMLLLALLLAPSNLARYMRHLLTPPRYVVGTVLDIDTEDVRLHHYVRRLVRRRR